MIFINTETRTLTDESKVFDVVIVDTETEQKVVLNATDENSAFNLELALSSNIERLTINKVF